MRMLKNFFKKFNMLLVILINILYTLYEEQISKGKKKYIMNLKKLVDYILLILDLFEVNWFEQLLRELLQIFTYKLETYIMYENINEFCESLEKTTEIVEKLAENSDKSSIDIIYFTVLFDDCKSIFLVVILKTLLKNINKFNKSFNKKRAHRITI